MMNWYLREDTKAYDREILDVVRVFLPNFIYAPEEDETTETIWVEDREQMRYLHIGSECLEIDLNGRTTPQQKRRALALALYRYLQQRLQHEGSSWGTLTGMRPNKLVHRQLDRGKSSEEIKIWLKEEYVIAEEKADLLVEIAQKERKFFAPMQDAVKEAGIYIAIPFCPSRCAYCTFPSFQLPKEKILDEYLLHLKKEILAVGNAARQKGQRIRELYIGGGTPTTLNSARLEELISWMLRCFGENYEEFTVEAGRPDTIDLEKLETLRRLGVNRISINPQSMWEPTLKKIGRKHTTADIVEKYHMARDVGFDCINMDLIIGLPGEKVEHFAYTLEQMERLRPDNLTLHTLAVKRASRIQQENGQGAPEEEIIKMAEMLPQWVKQQGYEPYYLYRQKHMLNNLENVGYALPGKESVYNILMMEERQSIYGLGVGSSSKYLCSDGWNLDGDFNPKDLILYNQRIEEIITRKVDKIMQLR